MQPRWPLQARAVIVPENGPPRAGSGGLSAAQLLRPLNSSLNIAEIAQDTRFPWQLDPGQLRGLSLREQEVFLLLGFGLSNRSISKVLGITERTVKAHIGRVLAKLTLESRLQAGLAAFALLTAGAEVGRYELLPMAKRDQRA